MAAGNTQKTLLLLAAGTLLLRLLKDGGRPSAAAAAAGLRLLPVEGILHLLLWLAAAPLPPRPVAHMPPAAAVELLPSLLPPPQRAALRHRAST